LPSKKSLSTGCSEVGGVDTEGSNAGERLSDEQAAPPTLPLSRLEREIIRVISGATFPPATASKRFVRDLSCGHVRLLSERGRCFLAFIAHRFRRQYVLTAEQWAWVDEYLAKWHAARVAK